MSRRSAGPYSISAVGVVEELHDVHPDDSGRRPLLRLPQRPHSAGGIVSMPASPRVTSR